VARKKSPSLSDAEPRLIEVLMSLAYSTVLTTLTYPRKQGARTSYQRAPRLHLSSPDRTREGAREPGRREKDRRQGTGASA